MNQPLVSTIIPVFNRPDMVVCAVESVIAQTYTTIEIILVNDGSTDGETPQILEEMVLRYPDTCVVIHKENGGPGLAREAGRQVARGEFIQYLDSDDYLLERKFEVQVKALLDNPDCDIAYGRSRLESRDGTVLSEPSKQTGYRHEFLFPALLVDRWWHTHTPLFRRSISDAAGAWPRRRPEDWDLEARMGALRARLVFCDEVLSCQVAHEGEERVSSGSMEKYYRDEAWFLPRLYDCARKGGVEEDAQEMHVFSRWAYFLARQLARMNESKAAEQILELAIRAGGSNCRELRLFRLSAQLLGWRSTAQLAAGARRILKGHAGQIDSIGRD